MLIIWFMLAERHNQTACKLSIHTSIYVKLKSRPSVRHAVNLPGTADIDISTA